MQGEQRGRELPEERQPRDLGGVASSWSTASTGSAICVIELPATLAA
ncbi:hypothetical protein [Streptomyces sp. NPDC090445]